MKLSSERTNQLLRGGIRIIDNVVYSLLGIVERGGEEAIFP